MFSRCLKGWHFLCRFWQPLKGTSGLPLYPVAVYFVLYLLTAFASSHASIFHSIFSTTVGGLNATFAAGIIAVTVIGLLLVAGINSAAVLVFVCFYFLENLRRPATLGYLSDRIKGSVMATGLSGESQLKTLMVAVISPVFGLGG